MADKIALEKLREGPRAWNAWREQNPNIAPNLRGAIITSGQKQLGPIHGGPIDLSGVDLSGVDLRNATLIEASLADAFLVGTNLSYARLASSDLTGADLTGADLDCADLAGAVLSHTILNDAELQLARNVTQAQINSAVGNDKTRLPASIRRPWHWRRPQTGEVPVEQKFDIRMVIDFLMSTPGIAQGTGEAVFSGWRNWVNRPTLRLGAILAVIPLILLGIYSLGGFDFYPSNPPERPERAAVMKTTDVSSAAEEAEAERLRVEDEVWRQARDVGSIGSFQSYLKDYSDGRYAEQASEEIAALEANAAEEARLYAEDQAWERAKGAGSIASFDGYLKSYSKGRYADQATKEIEALKEVAMLRAEDDAWSKAQEIGSIGSYESYLNDYSSGRYTDQASQRIATLREAAEEAARVRDEDEAWKNAESGGSIASYETYLDAYKKGRYRDEASQKIAALNDAAEKKAQLRAEDETWEKVQSDNSIRGFKSYLKNYANGRYVNQASKKIAALKEAEAKAELMRVEDDVWRKANNVGSIPAYQGYLNRYRQGRYADKASQKIASLEEVEAKAARLRAEEEAWGRAKDSGSISAFRAYLKSYSEGRYSEQASKKIAALEQASAEEARVVEEDKAWERARGIGSIAAFEAYLRSYAQGRYSDQATAKVASLKKIVAEIEARKADNEAWLAAKKEATIDAFRRYLQAFKNGRHVERAKSAISELKAAKAERENPAPKAAAPAVQSRPKRKAAVRRKKTKRAVISRSGPKSFVPTADEPF